MKNRNYNIGVKGLLMLGLMFIIGCTSTKHLPFESFSLEPHTEKTLAEQMEQVENSNPYTQISRFSAEYAGVEEQSNFKGYVRIAQDSLLMMSMSGMVGGEAYRVLLSSERSQTLNRLDETYTVADYDAAQQIIPIPYELLQAVLSYHFTSLIDEDYELSIADRMYLLEDKKGTKDYTSLSVDANYRVRFFYYKDFETNSSVKVSYNTYFEVDDQLFPQGIQVQIDGGKQTVILHLNLKRVDFKDKMTFPFSIPDHYLN